LIGAFYKHYEDLEQQKKDTSSGCNSACTVQAGENYWQFTKCLLVLDSLPRNAVGKVMKPAVAALFQAAGNDPAI
jgi:hypothetical protein